MCKGKYSKLGNYDVISGSASEKSASVLTPEFLKGSSNVKKTKYVFELRSLTRFWAKKKTNKVRIVFCRRLTTKRKFW